MCVRRNAQHRDLQLPKSTRFVLFTVVVVAVSTNGPVYLVGSTPLSSQTIQSHEKCPASHKVLNETSTMSSAVCANCEGKERVREKGSRIQSSRTGSALMRVL